MVQLAQVKSVFLVFTFSLYWPPRPVKLPGSWLLLLIKTNTPHTHIYIYTHTRNTLVMMTSSNGPATCNSWHKWKGWPFGSCFNSQSILCHSSEYKKRPCDMRLACCCSLFFTGCVWNSLCTIHYTSLSHLALMAHFNFYFLLVFSISSLLLPFVS